MSCCMRVANLWSSIELRDVLESPILIRWADIIGWEDGQCNSKCVACCCSEGVTVSLGFREIVCPPPKSEGHCTV